MALGDLLAFSLAGCAGVLLGAGLVYVGCSYRLRLLQATEAADARFFSQLAVEQKAWMSTEGRVLKDTFLNIEERLMYKQFPLTQWSCQKRMVNQGIDSEAVTKIARELSKLVTEATPIAINTKILRGALGVGQQ